MKLTNEETRKREEVVKKMIAEGASLSDLARHFKVKEDNMRRFLKRRRWKTKGMKQAGDHQA